MLAGYADRSGSTQYNVGLSNRRNASVQTYLVGKGIPSSAISSEGFGEANPRVPTADGVRELQNRRVEVYLVAMPKNALHEADAAQTAPTVATPIETKSTNSSDENTK